VEKAQFVAVVKNAQVVALCLAAVELTSKLVAGAVVCLLQLPRLAETGLAAAA